MNSYLCCIGLMVFNLFWSWCYFTWRHTDSSWKFVWCCNAGKCPNKYNW